MKKCNCPFCTYGRGLDTVDLIRTGAKDDGGQRAKALSEIIGADVQTNVDVAKTIAGAGANDIVRGAAEIYARLAAAEQVGSDDPLEFVDVRDVKAMAVMITGFAVMLETIGLLDLDGGMALCMRPRQMEESQFGGFDHGSSELH